MPHIKGTINHCILAARYVRLKYASILVLGAFPILADHDRAQGSFNLVGGQSLDDDPTWHKIDYSDAVPRIIASTQIMINNWGILGDIPDPSRPPSRARII